MLHWLSKKYFIFILAASSFILVFNKCRKFDDFDNNPSVKLSFSTDTIIFDTVFTSIGSVTQYLRVYNPHSNAVKISSISLAGGTTSNYRINIDGSPSLVANDVEIAANDSLYIFIRVTIDPNDNTLPFVVSDSVVFLTNGNYQDVDLVAFGQNANYIVANQHIQGFPKFKIVAGENEHVEWTNELPYVIYGYAVIDSAGSLSIDAGTQIYFHDGSGLWVYRGGQITVNGTPEEPVAFQGDRLESFFDDLPGQWDRIWIMEGSTENEINYAIIRNGFIGLQVENFNINDPLPRHLLLSNTVIENMSGVGILARWYNITGFNNVIANCGNYGLALTWGGSYDFRQCTFANYWNYSARQTANLVMTNFFVDNEYNTYAFDLTAYFGNCINYGNLTSEIDTASIPEGTFDFTFENCLLKTNWDISNQSTYPGSINNEDPLFIDYTKNDYHLDSLSPAVDAGNIDVINSSPYIDIQKDLDGNSRTVNPDMGAYEFIGSR
ncbi:MAG: hypothetical protein U9R60_14395 [Bacteroidota bacterium]|nr:hypothetical protein [Bacteroidota bacterium]